MRADWEKNRIVLFFSQINIAFIRRHTMVVDESKGQLLKFFLERVTLFTRGFIALSKISIGRCTPIAFTK